MECVMETKCCTRCKREFENNNINFVVDKRNKYGTGSACRECERNRLNKYHRLHLDKSKEYREKNSDILKLKKHLDYIKNKEKCNTRSKLEYQNNKQKYNELSKEWKKNNRKKVNELSREYYSTHKKEHSAITKKWKVEHREERNIQWQKRYSLKKQLKATLTLEQWKQTKLYFNNRCAYCGKEKSLNQEHFIALSKGGEYTQENIIPSCLNCNCSKSTKDFFEWYKTYKYYSKEREEQILMFFSYISKMKGVCQNGKY